MILTKHKYNELKALGVWVMVLGCMLARLLSFDHNEHNVAIDSVADRLIQSQHINTDHKSQEFLYRSLVRQSSDAHFSFRNKVKVAGDVKKNLYSLLISETPDKIKNTGYKFFPSILQRPDYYLFLFRYTLF